MITVTGVALLALIACGNANSDGGPHSTAGSGGIGSGVAGSPPTSGAGGAAAGSPGGSVAGNSAVGGSVAGSSAAGGSAAGGSSGSNTGGDSSADDASPPDFGPNVIILDPTMSVDVINMKLTAAAAASKGFDEVRRAVYFLPGTYGTDSKSFINSEVGFMMTAQGLGASPDDVTINGNLRVGAKGTNALATFWRSLANVKINPIETDEDANTIRWSTSQASPVRRVHVEGNLDLSGGQSFGNFMANSRVSGEVRSGFAWTADGDKAQPGQAQYYIRDSEIGSFPGRGADMTFSGVKGAPPTAFAPGDKTTLATTPVSREAPFLYFDGKNYRVFVPKARVDAMGVAWDTTGNAGVSLRMSAFLIAKPSDSAATINDALAQGKNLILTPGVYKLDQPIHITRAGTVVMGMGFATVTPTNGTAAVQVDDVAGVVLASFMVDANSKKSDVLVQVGPAGAHQGTASDPTSLSDVFVRVGGSYAGLAGTSLEINQNYVLVDHTWLWRADHGNTGTTGWTVNTSDQGMVVNGDNVTVLGLFVEHHQKSQVKWNGNSGRTIFMECEAPYDPPSQAKRMNGTENGYPCYAVGDGVLAHDASGLVSWTLFQGGTVYAHSSVKAPAAANVKFMNIGAGTIALTGGFEHVINDVPLDSNASFLSGISAIHQLAKYP